MDIGLKIFFGAMLVPIAAFIVGWLVCRITAFINWRLELKEHRGDTWLEPTILTAELAKHGYVYMFSRNMCSHISVLEHGMWKSTFDRLMEAVKDVPSSEVRCAILSRKLCAWRIVQSD
jgi:hypothetical protein